jgi:hypothetical protein
MKDPANRELVTVIECICADGIVIEPYIIMPNKVFIKKMFNNNLGGKTKISTLETSYSDDELGLKWL